MPKRALGSAPDDSSSSSSSSRSKLPCLRFQLLHDLPAPLFSVVCFFLSLHQVVSVLRSTCRALHDAVSEDCLQHHHLAITDRTLPSLLASSPSTRALIRRISSLGILHQWRKDDTNPQSAMPVPVQPSPLQAAQDASLLQFSSLSSLYINVWEISRQQAPTPELGSLLSLLQLLAANPTLSSSLHRLHIQDYCDDRGEVVVPLPVPELGRLQGLTHCRIQLQITRALSCESLVSALSSMQSLTSLHLGNTHNDWRQLLPLLCADAATPLLLRLQSLVLPFSEDDSGNHGSFDEQHDAFLCRLSSLPAPPALQHFSGMDVKHRAAGLLSLFSLPHLTQLNMPGEVRLSELSAFASSFTCAPAPLVSLMLPRIQPEPEHGDEDEAAVADAAEATFSAMRRLLSRLTALRDLTCDVDIFSGAAALSDSLASDGASGCCASLYRLRLNGTLSLLPFAAPPSFPLLTELVCKDPMMEVDLGVLLAGCPRLLVLSCTVQRNCWRAVNIAARCCRRLLRLMVEVEAAVMQPAHRRRYAASATAAATTTAKLNVSGPFLPELISLSLYDGSEPRPQPELSLLQHFTTSPRPELRFVELVGVGLTAQHVLSLACLSGLSYLQVKRRGAESGGIAEVNVARIRAAQQLLSRGVADRAYRDAHCQTALREQCEDSTRQPATALGPHQQQEMRLRVLKETEEFRYERNVLAIVEEADRDMARAVFFDELRSVLRAPAASKVSGSKGRQ